jgi:hypothetical protein
MSTCAARSLTFFPHKCLLHTLPLARQPLWGICGQHAARLLDCWVFCQVEWLAWVLNRHAVFPDEEDALRATKPLDQLLQAVGAQLKAGQRIVSTASRLHEAHRM